MNAQSQRNNAAWRRSAKSKIQRQRQLGWRKALQIAWRNIRQRLGRSFLVTSGIVLALAFLTYILCSDALLHSVIQQAPRALLDELARKGITAGVTSEDARIQTRWMVGLALLVSFVGILNAMLLSVTERFKEIGTMKCLGALDSLIVELFLLESAFQGLVGTALGVLAGLVLTFSEGVKLYGAAVWGMAPWLEFVKIVGMCTLIGVGLTVVAALYPAWRAARMEPVQAMRMEI